jgi:hypothetical protein
MEDFHDRGRDADVAPLADELIGHAVPVAVDLDVVVDVDRGGLPDRVLVGLRGQGPQGRPIELGEQAETAPRQLPKRARVEPREPLTDRLVRLRDREERAVAQGGEDPALDDQHALLRLRLVVSLRLLAVPAVRGASSSPTRSIP